MRDSGFSLLELSIVLVIIGLLAGGVMTGQSLIRASELRSVTSDFTRYITAAQTFRDKYQALPGDMRRATNFWGDDNAECPDAAITNGVPGTCNGNGDGLLGMGAGAGSTGEMFQFWKQLALAGIIEGSYSGISDTDTDACLIGTNVPAARMSNAGWSVAAGNATAHPTGYFSIDYSRNRMMMGRAYAGEPPTTGVLVPEEAWNIDTKLDDGKPARGKVHIMRVSTCTTTSDPANLDAAYLLTSSAVGCVMVFSEPF